MKITVADVKAIASDRYLQIKRERESRHYITGIVCLMVGLAIVLVMLFTTFAPSKDSVATYNIAGPGQLVITGGGEVKFNDAKLPVLYSSNNTPHPDAADWIVIVIGVLVASFGVASLFTGIELTSESRHKYADAFVQKWIDTGELPPKESESK